MGDYQWLGDEVVISESSLAPSWDLDEYLVPGPGKVIFDGVTQVNWHYFKETAVFVLDPGQKPTLRGYWFAGGLVVYCPKDYDRHQGYRNLSILKDQTCGGGGGVLNIGIIAPGGKVRNGWDGNWISGFHFVNELGHFRNSEIIGQMVILNRVKNLDNCEITYSATAAESLHPGISFGISNGYTKMLEVFEDFN